MTKHTASSSLTASHNLLSRRQKRDAHKRVLGDDIARMAICGDIDGLREAQENGCSLSRTCTFLASQRMATPVIFMIEHHQDTALDWLLGQKNIWLDHVSWVRDRNSTGALIRGTALDAACQENGLQYVDRLLEAGATKALWHDSRQRLKLKLPAPIVRLPF